jgi:hypothetical protein
VAEFKLISEQQVTVSNLEALYNFLIDFKNFESILPTDKIEDFKVLDTSCSFVIKGITPITIKIKEQNKYDYILFSSEGLAKFDFDLHVFFIGQPTSNVGTCRIEMVGNLNPFIKAMAEKPLLALINSMSLKLSQLKIN